MNRQIGSGRQTTGLGTLARIGLLACALTLPMMAQAKTIILRDDDAEPYFSSELFRTITDTVISNGVAQTIGVVPSHPSGTMLYEDTLLTTYLNSIKGLPGVELALHGYQHSYYEFANLNLVDAEAKIAAGIGVLQSVLGVTPVTFIPPQNAFNADTLQACRNEGLTRFSAAGYNDPDVLTERPAGLLHVPSTVDFQDWNNGGVVKSSAAIIQECQTALATRDVIVVQIHFWAFADSNDVLDPVLYQTLVDVLSWIRSQAAQGVALKTIAQYVPPPPPVTAKILKVTVNSANDDAYEVAGTMYPAAMVTVAGRNGTKVNRAGFRFASVQLPKTAQISSAVLTLYYNWANGASTDTVLYGEANDLSAAFGTTANDLSSRARTLANVPWSSLPILSYGKPISAPDVTAIVQEIVNRPAWVTGNPITFLQYEAPTAVSAWEAITFEGAGTKAYKATLRIEYMEGGAQTPPQINVARTPQANAFGWNNSAVTATYAATAGSSALVSPATGTFVFSTEGASQAYTFTVTDTGGNSASATVSGVNIDLTPPQISVVLTPPANAFGWNNTPVTATYTATDSGSGLVSPATGSFVFSTEGAGQEHTFTVTDAAGNSASVTVNDVNIDLTAPVATATVAPAANAAGWNNSPVTVIFDGTDALSGVGSTADAVVLSADGASQTATGTCTDLADNVGWITLSGINVDLTPPQISVVLTPPANAFGWNNTPVTATYTAIDSGSGLVSPATGSFVFSTEGAGQEHTFTVTDAAGNSASATVSDINIDLTPPAVFATAAPAANALGWNNSAVTATYTATDSGSGLASPATGSYVFSSEGAGQEHTFTVTDAAGNSASATVSDINIDLTPPMVTAAAAPAANALGWNNGPVTVAFSGSDALSGVDSTAAPVVLSTDGANLTATGTCTDKAGNIGTFTLAGVKIDQTPPQISVARSPAANAAGWNNTAVTATYSATDGGSGLASPATGSYVFSTEGAGQTRTFTVTDAAGNSVSATVSGINIDLTAPPVPVITGYPTNPSTTTSATFTFTDTESGVTFLCQRDLGGYQACTSPVNYTSLAQGSHRFDLKARDQAGNESVVASYSWTIDTRPAAPTGLTAAAGNASVKLTWQTAARATSYKVKRATVSGGPYTVVATGITALTWTNTGLANGTTYYYVVSAVNTAGEGANSVPASATPLAPPAAPTNLAVAVVSSTQLNLSWTDNSTNETGFRIERSLNGSSFSEIATVGANVRTYSSTGLTPNTVYYYRVRAYNAAGNSAYTGVKSARTKA